MKIETRKAVEEKIRELVPKLQEVSFGCYYETESGTHRVGTGNYIVEEDKKRVRITSICNHPTMTDCCGEYQDQNDEDYHKKILNIIGHPIQLRHVLMATRKYVASNNPTATEYAATDKCVVGAWNMREPLSDQPDEVHELLAEVLEV